MDTLTKKQRSRLMSRIRSVSKLEMRSKAAAERRAGCGLRHGTRRGAAGLPGTPDWLSKGNKVAVFIHGCFWHGCPRHYREPRSNTEFWRAKIARNRARDRRVAREFRALGWRVFSLWEHSLKRRAR